MRDDLPDRIEFDPAVMLGKPVIRGTRVTVEILVEKVGGGRGIEEVLSDYPFLEPEDVEAALEYHQSRFGSS